MGACRRRRTVCADGDSLFQASHQAGQALGLASTVSFTSVWHSVLRWHIANNLGLRLQATDLFEQAYRRALWRNLWGRLTGRTVAVQCLSGVGSGTRGAGLHAGPQTVSIAQIRGSEGRCQGFDAEFAPLHRQDKRRWVDLCVAWLSGVILLPVELIQVDDVYYVRDGHHRVSVARALGQEHIDAEVVRWE